MGGELLIQFPTHKYSFQRSIWSHVDSRQLCSLCLVSWPLVRTEPSTCLTEVKLLIFKVSIMNCGMVSFFPAFNYFWRLVYLYKEGTKCTLSWWCMSVYPRVTLNLWLSGIIACTTMGGLIECRGWKGGRCSTCRSTS